MTTRYQEIDKHLLQVDIPSYQRTRRITDRKIAEMAANLDMTLCETLSVARRVAGSPDKFTFWIMDGQLRHMAAMRCESITTLPCIVSDSQGIQWEADMFNRLNSAKQPTPMERFRARETAGEPLIMDIVETLRGLGLVVKTGGNEAGTVQFVSLLLQCWRQNRAACVSALRFQVALHEDTGPHSLIHKGLFWLACRGVNIEAYAGKLERMGGRAKILHEIHASAGMAGENAARYGRAVLRLINHGLRNRVEVAE